MNESRSALRGQLLVGGAAVAALALVVAYLAAGGASYTPEKVRDPCQHRPWSNPEGLGEIANQFTTSALDGAACKLGVSREELARALATPEARERFADRYGIDDAEEAGALSPLLAGPLRSTVEDIPLEQAIELVQDARSLLNNVQGFLGPAERLLEQLIP